MGRMRRAHVIAMVLAIAINLGGAGVALRLYVFPNTDAPAPTDVVYVIGPATASRVAIAEQMVAAGLTTNVMVSVAADGEFSAANVPVCKNPQTFTVYCVTPDPFTTQGEARDLRALSAEHGWTSATVITFTPHVTRSRIIMQRCFAGDLRLVADDTHLAPARWAYEMLYQTGAFLKVLTDTGC